MILPARSRQAGFTVLEIVVSLGLVLLGVALASSLLLRSQIAANRAVSALRNPQPRFASVRLRHDLESGRVQSAFVPGWRSEPLRVLTGEGGLIAWRTDGTTLRREALDRDGRPAAVQVVLREVEGWRWRRPTPGLVDVEIRFRMHDASGAVLLDRPRSWRARTVVQTESLRVAARQGPGW